MAHQTKIKSNMYIKGINNVSINKIPMDVIRYAKNNKMYGLIEFLWLAIPITSNTVEPPIIRYW